MQSTAALGKEGRKNASMNIDPDNDDFSVRGFIVLLTIHVLHAMMDLPFFDNDFVSIK